VPTTVLNAIVENSVYLDPYIGLNNLKIPGLCEEFNRKYKLSGHSYLPGEKNYLAVKIYPLDHPGTLADPQINAMGPFGPNGGTSPKLLERISPCNIQLDGTGFRKYVIEIWVYGRMY
jgi:hypothetical protein